MTTIKATIEIIYNTFKIIFLAPYQTIWPVYGTVLNNYFNIKGLVPLKQLEKKVSVFKKFIKIYRGV
ncbi:hypothetical protein GCM10028778_07560 [Barrientosiimonas marina]